jgi:hypothetical protein
MTASRRSAAAHPLFWFTALKKQAAIARVKWLTLTQIPNLREDVPNLREDVPNLRE